MLEEILSQFPWLTKEFAGVAAWLWIVLPGLFVASWIIMRTLVAMGMGITGSIMKHKQLFENYIKSLSGPIALFLTGLVFVAGQGLLPLEEAVVAKLTSLNAAIFTFAVAWGLIRVTHNVLNVLQNRFVADGRAGAAAIIPLMRKLAKATIVVLAIIFLLQNWGFDVAEIIAALGVGGIALALASQKSVENLFGGL
ncbi:MAG: mechanosensitive ion channel family protein, partial [Alphaproteobacteria bacterium]|nr:mechanosensitive ion channel family protein [Alphaproteobacteria bacterium]